MAMIRLERLFSGRSNAAEPDPDSAQSGSSPLQAEDDGFADRLRRAIAQPARSAEESDLLHRRLPSDTTLPRPGQPVSQSSQPESTTPYLLTAASLDPSPQRPPEPKAHFAGLPDIPTHSETDPDPAPSPSPPPEPRAGRVRTRLLGHDHVQNLVMDPIDAGRAAPASAQGRFPVGWIVVTEGPGKGSFFTLFNGVSQIGRGADQAVSLDLGDMSISRNNHAAIAYDDEANAFFLGHGGKTNLVRLNHKPVISTEPLHHLDMIRLGETTLRFVALCKDDFRWENVTPGGSSRV